MNARARKVVWDTGWSLGLNLTLRAASALAFIALGRLGRTSDAGVFSLATGYLSILTTIFLGLDDILVREVARRPDQSWPILATYGFLRSLITLAVWGGLLALLSGLSLYDRADLFVLAVITGSVFLDTLSALGQAMLNAHHHFRWPFVATLVGSVVKLAGALLAIQKHWGLLAVAWAWPIGSAIGAMVMVFAVWRYLRQWPRPAVLFDRRKGLELARLVPAFVGTSLLSGLEYQLDVILVSVMASHVDVAEYSAAVTIMLAVLTVSQAYRIVLYPMLVQSLSGQAAQARQWVGRSLLLMGGIALASAVTISWAAPWVIQILFGDRFELAGGILRVLIWNVLWFFLNVPLVRFMMAANGQGVVFRTLLVSLTVNVLANLILIPWLGPLGPAYARLLSSGLFCVLMAWAVGRRLLRPVRVTAN